MTLYVFTKDDSGSSTCYDQCAEKWPPLLVETEAVSVAPLNISGTFGIAERSDGGRQVTYNGWPLYYWINDAAVGDATGQGVGDVWYVANLNPVIQMINHPEHGDILVGPTGMTLYIFKKDEAGKTNCYEGCALRWPPLMGAFEPMAGIMPSAAEGIMGKLDVIARDDGGKQLTYNGEPLYYWINDHKPGDATGQNVGEVWFVLKP
jgi:predicted lipoprotein with Yx(FWY)xxD motif